MTNIEIKKITVWIQEEYQDKLLDINEQKLDNVKILKEFRKINKWLIGKLTWLTEDQINELDAEVYSQLQEKAWVLVNVEKSFWDIKAETIEENELDKKKDNSTM